MVLNLSIKFSGGSMPTLMVSISGIRGIVGDGLDPQTIIKYTSAYAEFCGKGKIVVGRDARSTGEMVKSIIAGTLLAKGNDVVDIGICPTPTVLLNVKNLKAAGGIAISASHNPNEWNALKLMNKEGEFMTPDENKEMLSLLDKCESNYMPWNSIGKYTEYKEGLEDHIKKALSFKYLDLPALKKRRFKVLLDAVNGAGAYAMPPLLKELGCEVVELNCEKSGIFPRLPEPIPENLKETMLAVKKCGADIGIVVDPDVDRLVLITNEGEAFSEENTITQAVKYILSKEKGNCAVNLSTTRGVDDAAAEYGCTVFRSPVGEANVVQKMKEVNAIIGGEGSGGVIYPELLFGRDALAGTVIMLQHLLEFGGTMGELKRALPRYFISKKKIAVGSRNPDEVIKQITMKYANEKINTEDGLRIDFPDHWVHLRKSNTEPIIRCIVEASTEKKADELMERYFKEIS
jgi:phosphomannomutase